MPWIASPATRPSAASIASRRRDLKGASFSDVHLGHPQTPTSSILTNLRRAFPDTEETAELDLLLLGGDLFDAALAYADGLIPEIEAWALYLLRLCAKHRIVFRILEGTHSHDRNQSAMFLKLVAHHAIDVDILYVDKVWVEKHEALGISILYVPDFTTIDEQSMWEKVEAALLEAGVEQVDYVNLHGAFSYQMPPIPDVQRTCHRMERFLRITRQYLFTGHIHLPSVYERIYCNGSFDRLNHGEEGPKGHWRFHVPTSGEDDITFIENVYARRYDTVDCKTLSLEDALRKVEMWAEALPPGSHLRVEAERGHGIFLSMARLRMNFPFLHWTMKAVASEKIEVTDDDPVLPAPLAVKAALTVETLGTILQERMVQHHVAEPIIQHAAALLPTYL